MADMTVRRGTDPLHDDFTQHREKRWWPASAREWVGLIAAAITVQMLMLGVIWKVLTSQGYAVVDPNRVQADLRRNDSAIVVTHRADVDSLKSQIAAVKLLITTEIGPMKEDVSRLLRLTCGQAATNAALSRDLYLLQANCTSAQRGVP